jgi:hypothetical protein
MSDLTTLLRKKPSATKKNGGRKNTKIIENIPKSDNMNIESDENIIIHLPIKGSECSNDYNQILDIPTGYENNTQIFQHISQKDNPFKDNELIGMGPPPSKSMCQYPFDDNKIDNDEVISHNNSNMSYVDLKELKRQRDLDILGKNKMTKSSVEKCLLEMDECNKTKSWPSNVNIHCWWCCHPFDNPPCSIPYEFKNGTYSVYGIFCSPECAASYNFSDTHGISDMWERYSLLNFLYRTVYDTKSYKIKLAPPRQTLKIFGGHLDINDFRANFSNQLHSYKIIMPPMVSIIPVQELSAIDRGFTSKQDKLLKDNTDTISLDTISQQNSGLRLKRSKPFVASKNTLEKCMNLKLNELSSS